MNIGIIIFLIILAIWIITGIASFIMSIICFGYDGDFGDKVMGFVIALFGGPFYWLYYIYNGGYCLKKQQINT